MQSRKLAGAPTAFIFLWVLLAALRLWSSYDVPCADEQWYALVTREWLSGRALYSDLRFTQPPFFVFLYAPALSLFGPVIWPGRAMSVALAALGLLALCTLMKERYGARAACVGLCLAFMPAFAIADIVVFTEPMSFCTFALALLAAHRLSLTGSRNAAIALGLCCGFAVAGRFALMPLVLIAAVWLAVRFRPSFLAWFLGLLPGFGLIAYFLITRTDAFLFNTYRFHVLMGQGIPMLDQTIGFVADWIRDSTPEIIVGVAAVVTAARAPWRKEKHIDFELVTVAAFVVITLFHATRKPAYSVYQYSIYAAPIVMAGWLWARLERRFSALASRPVPALALSLCAFVGLAVNLNAARSAPRLAPAATLLGPLRAAGAQGPFKLVTLEPGIPYLVPQARVPHGYEMGIFALRPPVPDAVQERYHGLTERRLVQDIESHTEWVALSCFSILWLSKEARWRIVDAVDTFYDPVLATPGYGMYGDTDGLMIWRRKNPGSIPNAEAQRIWAKWESVIKQSP